MQITVKGGEFKRIFKFIGTLVRKTDLSKSVAFTIYDGRLHLTFSAGYAYNGSVEIISDKSRLVETNCTVYYNDIADYISAKEEITLEFTPNGIWLCGETLEVTLRKSDSVVNRLEKDKEVSDYNSLDQGKVVSVLNTLTSTEAVGKTLKTSKPITIYNKVARIDYSTVIFECELDFPNCTLNTGIAKLISSFAPSDYMYTHDTLIFTNRKRTEELWVAWSKPARQETFTGFKPIAEFTVGDELPRIKGNVCTFLVFKEGYKVHIEDISSATIDIAHNATGNMVMSFSVALEYLNVFFKLLKDDKIILEKGDGIICLKGRMLSIMTSY